jgi:N-acetylneuraminate synthase
MTARTFIIAEAGVNHNGSVDRALRLIDAAHAAGADAVKFQTFNSTRVISRFAAKAEYQISATGDAESQLDMVRKLELDLAAHRTLVAQCVRRGIQFLSTPFDEASVDWLARELAVPLLKIPSGEITNALLLLKVARSGLPAFLSTGMSNLGDIERALGVLAFGYLGEPGVPGAGAFEAAYRSAAGRAMLGRKLTLMHCTTEYPAPLAEVNLRVMDTLRAAFELPVGYSDHTPGIVVPIAAVARGAVVIEKHFTLDRSLPGPDHLASLEPAQLKAMVEAIRDAEVALGSGIKCATASESKNQPIARKSLTAACDIAAGEIFTAENLTAKRPGNGVSPMLFWTYLGRPARRAYTYDELIDAHED